VGGGGMLVNVEYICWHPCVQEGGEGGAGDVLTIGKLHMYIVK
jgi:hypothetical protein